MLHRRISRLVSPLYKHPPCTRIPDSHPSRRLDFPSGATVALLLIDVAMSSFYIHLRIRRRCRHWANDAVLLWIGFALHPSCVRATESLFKDRLSSQGYGSHLRTTSDRAPHCSGIQRCAIFSFRLGLKGVSFHPLVFRGNYSTQYHP